MVAVLAVQKLLFSFTFTCQDKKQSGCFISKQNYETSLQQALLTSGCTGCFQIAPLSSAFPTSSYLSKSCQIHHDFLVKNEHKQKHSRLLSLAEELVGL